MVTTCVAFGCSNRYSKCKDIGFYRFPHDPVRRKRWGLALRRKDFEPRDSHRICGAHFQSGKPSSNPKHPDYVPNVFVFQNPFKKHKKWSKKEQEDPKIIVIKDVLIEDNPISSELFSTRDLNIEGFLLSCLGPDSSLGPGLHQPQPPLKLGSVSKLSEIQNILQMKSEIEKQTTENVHVKEDIEIMDSDATQSACGSFGAEQDEYLSLKLELYEAFTDINTLKKQKDDLLKLHSASEAERIILMDSVSEKEAELSKLKIELQQAYEEINVLRSERDAMQKKVASSDITNRVLQDAKALFFYTGLHSTKDFHSILALIYDVDTSIKLFPLTTQLLIALMRLRLNLLYTDLSFRFHTSRTTAKKICDKIIPSLGEKLELLIKSPVTNALKKTLPPSYHKNAIFENLYNRIQKYVKSEAKQSENEDADFEIM